jgi:hypothetical protein
LVLIGASGALSPATQIPPPPQEPLDVEGMTCGEIEFIFGDEEREVDASYLAVWGYGVKTGATGMDFEKHPLTVDGLSSFVSHLLEVCDRDSDKRFVKAILE